MDFIKRHRYGIVICIISVVFLFLMSSQYPYLIPHAGYDDGLMLNLAQNLRCADWLGSYDNLTLAKGITFPFWMAVMNFIHIPLLWANFLLFMLSCLLITYALKPLIKNRLCRVLLYTFLLFGPYMLTHQLMRIYRESIAPSLCLLVLSWVIGIFTRYAYPDENFHKDIRLFVITGFISLPMWWFLREDSYWLLPIIICGLLLTAILIFSKKKRKNMP